MCRLETGNKGILTWSCWSINSTRPSKGNQSPPSLKPNEILYYYFAALLFEGVMAPLKLHGSFLSTNTQRVLATLYEKEVEFELVNVNLGAGEQKQEPHISLNVSNRVILKEKCMLFIFFNKWSLPPPLILRRVLISYADNDIISSSNDAAIWSSSSCCWWRS